MTAAIELSNKFNVTLITKNSLVDSSTWYAQGGIAAVIDSNDSIESIESSASHESIKYTESTESIESIQAQA